MHINLSYSVTRKVQSSILEIEIIGNMEGKNQYRITDFNDRLMMCGYFEGKLKKTCLYVGCLPVGEYFFQIDENNKEAFFVLDVL
jgi:hypothetical protein